MPTPVPQPYSNLARWAIRFRAEGSRLLLEPVAPSSAAVRDAILATLGFAAVATIPSLILLNAGQGRYIFIPMALAAFMWMLMLTVSTLTRRHRAEMGPVLVVDPEARTVELPHGRLKLAESTPLNLHLIRFRLSNRHRRRSRIHTVGPMHQLAVEVVPNGESPRLVPVLTGTIDRSVPHEARALADALRIRLLRCDAPDQRSEEWP